MGIMTADDIEKTSDITSIPTRTDYKELLDDTYYVPDGGSKAWLTVAGAYAAHSHLLFTEY